MAVVPQVGEERKRKVQKSSREMQRKGEKLARGPGFQDLEGAFKFGIPSSVIFRMIHSKVDTTYIEQAQPVSTDHDLHLDHHALYSVSR
jgi:hypothetical protein